MPKTGHVSRQCRECLRINGRDYAKKKREMIQRFYLRIKDKEITEENVLDFVRDILNKRDREKEGQVYWGKNGVKHLFKIINMHSPVLSWRNGILFCGLKHYEKR